MPAPSPIRPERIRSIVEAAKAAGAVRVRIGADGSIEMDLRDDPAQADPDLMEWKR